MMALTQDQQGLQYASADKSLSLEDWLYELGYGLLRYSGGYGIKDVRLTHEAAVAIAQQAIRYARELDATGKRSKELVDIPRR